MSDIRYFTVESPIDSSEIEIGIALTGVAGRFEIETIQGLPLFKKQLIDLRDFANKIISETDLVEQICYEMNWLHAWVINEMK